MSPRKNYNKMYDNKSEEPAVMTEVTPDEVIETTVEDIVKENRSKKAPSSGKVIGGSLNVRIKPDGNVKKVIQDGTIVRITEDAGDWYKISSPEDGYVMKKFIEV